MDIVLISFLILLNKPENQYNSAKQSFLMIQLNCSKKNPYRKDNAFRIVLISFKSQIFMSKCIISFIIPTGRNEQISTLNR